MSTKSKLLEKINHIDNDNYLEALLDFLEESEKSEIQLSRDDVKAIEKSTEQIKSDTYLSQPELVKKVNEWIDK